MSKQEVYLPIPIALQGLTGVALREALELEVSRAFSASVNGHALIAPTHTFETARLLSGHLRVNGIDRHTVTGYQYEGADSAFIKVRLLIKE